MNASASGFLSKYSAIDLAIDQSSRSNPPEVGNDFTSEWHSIHSNIPKVYTWSRRQNNVPNGGGGKVRTGRPTRKSLYGVALAGAEVVAWLPFRHGARQDARGHPVQKVYERCVAALTRMGGPHSNAQTYKRFIDLASEL